MIYEIHRLCVGLHPFTVRIMTDNNMNSLFDNTQSDSSSDGVIPDEVIWQLMKHMTSIASE